MVFTSLLSPSATLPVTKATSCKDLEIIFARGSGEKLGSDNFTAWKGELGKQLKSRTALTSNFYELGTTAYEGKTYPAIAIGLDDGLSSIINTISAKLSSIRLGQFNESIDDGVTELVGRVNSTLKDCKNTKFILGGYSQGALVVTRAMKKLDPEKILHVATFGDPNLYLPEGEGIMPPACRGKNLSPYRLYAPNCRAHSGILGISNPYEPTGYTDKVSLWCTKKDIVCSNYFDIENPLGGHMSYKSAGIFTLAAETIADRASTFFPDKQLRKPSFTPVKREVAILIDTTGSMAHIVEQYKKEAKKLAKTTLDEGGRVALFEYRDLSDPYDTKKLLDFGCTYQEFEKAIEELEFDGGGDTLESALSGSLFTMNNLKWRASATKSVVILTDAPYLSPDRDGVTVKDVAKRSLEIDPVNFYIITPEEIKSDYEELASLTGGRAFSLSEEVELSTNYLLSRPEINFALEEYSGKPGDEFTFEIKTPDMEHELVYDWDLDFDGEFETLNAGRIINHVYNREASGFIQVRATNRDGTFSTASALVAISNNLEPEPTLEITSFENNVVNFTTSDNTVATLVSSRGIPLGITYDHKLAIKDLSTADDLILSFTPITKSGLRGKPTLLSINSFGEDDTLSSPKLNLTKPSDIPPKNQIKAPRAGAR